MIIFPSARTMACAVATVLGKLAWFAETPGRAIISLVSRYWKETEGPANEEDGRLKTSGLAGNRRVGGSTRKPTRYVVADQGGAGAEALSMLFTIMSAVVLILTLAFAGVIPVAWAVPLILVALVISALGYSGYKFVGAVLALGSFCFFLKTYGGGGNGAKLLEIVFVLLGIWIMLRGIVVAFKGPNTKT